MEILLEPMPYWFEYLNRLLENLLIAPDQVTNAILMSREDLSVTLSSFRGEHEHDDPSILLGRAALDEARCLQPIRDCRDVALIGEQQATEINHGEAIGLAQVMQCPELSGAQPILTKKLTISVIQQVEQVGEQEIELLLWFVIGGK